MKHLFAIILILAIHVESFAQQYTITPERSVQRNTTRVQTSTIPKCSVTADSLKQIKSFITCLDSPLFGACGALGAYVVGRTAGAAFANKIKAAHEKAISEFLEAYQAALIKERGLVKVPRTAGGTSAAQITNIDLKRGTVDVKIPQINNSDTFIVKTLPINQVQDLSEGARVAVPRTNGGTTVGQILNSANNRMVEVRYPDTHGSRNTLVKTVDLKDLTPLDSILNNSSFKMELDDIRETLQRYAVNGTPIDVNTLRSASNLPSSTLQNLYRRYPRIAPQGLSRSILSAGAKSTDRFIGLALGGTTIASTIAYAGLTYSGSTACSALNEAYINGQEGNCTEPGAAQISEGVLTFLELSEEEQVAFLGNRDSKNCKFYEELYKNVFSHSVSNVTCNGNSANITMHDKTLGAYNTTIAFNESGDIDYITAGHGQNPTFALRISDNGSVQYLSPLDKQDPNFPGRLLQATKLFAPEIASCCSSSSDSERSSCLRDLNTSRTQRLLQESSQRGQGTR